MSTDPHRGDAARTVRRDHAEAARNAGPHPALITAYDSPPILTLVLPPGLGKDQVLAGLSQAIGQARAGLAKRARQFQQRVEEHAAAGDQLRQALCRGQVLASDDAAAHLDEAIVAAFDLWDQYDAQLAWQTTAATTAQAAAVTAAFPGKPPTSPAGAADTAGIPSPPQTAEGDVRPYIEAADEETLRRALRAVASQLDGLRQVARASQTLAESAKSAAHGQHAAALEAGDAGHPGGPSPDELTAVAVEAYAMCAGFDAGAFHIGLCVNAVAAALAGGLGLTGPSCFAPPGNTHHQATPDVGEGA